MKAPYTLSLCLALLATASAHANPPTQTPSPQRSAQTRTTPPRQQPRRPTRPVAPASPARPVVPAAPVTQPQPAPQPPPPASPNGALTADQIAQRIQDFYDRTTDFQADFAQISNNRLYGEERRNGRVVFRKPGRMRWNYAPPSGDIIVSNGTTLWAYQADERQAIQQTLTQSQMPTALAFLTGTGRITELFRFRLLDTAQYPYPGGHVLELRPNTPQPSYERIVFYVDGRSFQVARTVVIDAQGNRNRFDFLRPQVNMNVPDSTFTWSPPPGTSVVRP